jgi:Spherulation-specific family 4
MTPDVATHRPRHLVPAYIWAGDTRRWTRLLATPPDALIINPNNGPLQRPPKELYERVEAAAQGSTAVYGYVGVGWLRQKADVAGAQVAAELWHASFPDLAGIFYDEVPTERTDTNEAQLDELLVTGGMHTILNPGTCCPVDWFTRWPTTTFCTFEGTASNYLRSAKPPGPPQRQAALVYQCAGTRQRRAVLERAASDGLGWATATTGSLPNPWETVPEPSLHSLR